MPKVTYEENVKRMIKSLEDYKEKSQYNEKETELLKMEIAGQESNVNNLFAMAKVASSTQISYADRMVKEQDKLRDLKNKLAKREKVEKEVKEKVDNLDKYLGVLKDQKNAIKEKIKRATNQMSRYTEKINELKAKENKSPEELEEYNKLLEKRGKKEELRKALRGDLGEINKALKVAKDYNEKGIVPKDIEENIDNSKEKPEQEKNKDQKPEKSKENLEKPDDRKEGEILTGVDGTKVHFGNGTKQAAKKEIPADKEVPTQEETTKETEKSKDNSTQSKEGKSEFKGNEVPGVPQPEYEVHEAKDSGEENIYSNSYEKNLQEYKEMLSMYKDAFLILGDLQQQYENGGISYSEYEKQSLYVAERYEFMKGEYAKIKEQYDVEKAKKDKFANITNEDLENKLKELNDETTELWQQGVHENTPDAKRYHQALEEMKKIKEELKKRKENPLRGMSLEELEAKKSELYARIGEQQEPDEYHFRTHEENGLEGYEDEIDKGLREIREEIERRQPKLEAPEEPVKAGMILENDKEEITEKSNLPVRSFWEIYSETNSEHASNLAIKLHNFSHMKLLPRKEEDSMTKALSYGLLIFKLPLKVASIIPNKLMGTDKKLQEMQENIDELPPEEFQVLVSSADKVNEMFDDKVKDSFDKDYLDPQFMKQHKVNELYLKAVGSRLTRERQAGIQYYNNQVLEYDSRLNELDKISENRELTEDEELEYNKLTSKKQELEDKGKELRQEIDTFNDGVKKKSSAFKNIRGWFLGKFNPDNREENAKMAQMSKERREAGQIGNTSQVNRKTNEMKNYAKQQTNIRGLKNDKIDRGKYSIEDPIERLDRGEENRGRLLLTNVALVTSVIDLVQQITNVRNMQVTKEVEVSGEAKVSEIDGAKEAQAAAARQTVEGTFNRNERANLDSNNWDLNSSGYRAGDAITHADGAQAAKAVQDAIAKGDSEGALRIATEYFQRNASKDEAAMGSYAQNHAFDYSAVNFGGAKDAQTIMDFFGGTVKFSDTVKVTIDGINNGINPLAAIFAGANAMHQAQKQGVKDGFKEALKKSAKKKEETKEEKDEVETQGKETQENPSKEEER